MANDQISSSNIHTGIVYLSIPDQPLQLVQSRQSIDYKSQIEHDLSVRYQQFTDEDFPQLNAFDAQRYQRSYENLHEQVLQSIYKIIDLNDEILRVKHSIKYNTDILPILIQNHKLAKREKKILYEILTTTWQRVDQCIQTELNIQHQLEQIQREHQHFLQMKIQQEKSRQIALFIEQINDDIIDLEYGLLTDKIKAKITIDFSSRNSPIIRLQT